MVADPLRLMHCCPISDGAAAVVLSAERAMVRVAGVGHGADTLAVRHRRELTTFAATRSAAREAYAMAGFGAERIDVAEVHDAFAPFELISLEDLGLVPPGKAGRHSTATPRSTAGCPSTRRAASRRAAIRWPAPASPRSSSASGN